MVDEAGSEFRGGGERAPDRPGTGGPGPPAAAEKEGFHPFSPYRLARSS